jgi:hypothetical protein
MVTASKFKLLGEILALPLDSLDQLVNHSVP